MKTKLFLIILVFVTNVYAEHSMRRCLLLPIGDSVAGGIAFSVFQEVEKKLKDASWCDYVFNSQILDVLSSYKDNLDKHLQNPDILRAIGEKTRAGSLIKINVNQVAEGTEILLKVYSSNGHDLLLAQSSRIAGQDIDEVVRLIDDWLIIYEKTIPYDGLVVGVLGDQINAEFGTKRRLKPGDRVEILKLKRKEKHPLLKEVVAWSTESLALGKVIGSDQKNHQIQVLNYDSTTRVDVGDWVKIILTKEGEASADENTQDAEDPNKFGKIGEVGLFLTIGKADRSISDASGSSKKIGGYLIGAHLEGEMWITRNFFGGLEFARRFGTMRKESGTFIGDDKNTSTFGSTKVKLGYRYLPMGFFYGPRLEGYLGYAHYTFALENRIADRFVESNSKGLMLGLRGSMPIIRGVRGFIDFDFLVKGGYSEDVTVFGDAESVSSFNIEAGGLYVLDERTSLLASFEYLSHAAKFASDTQKVTSKETMGRFGVIYTF
jgi:hypothetical protein